LALHIRSAAQLRGTSVEALLPTALEGLAITELPEFVAIQYFREKQLEPLLGDWRTPEGGLYFVTPTARSRPAKVSALADFLIAKADGRTVERRGRCGMEVAGAAQEAVKNLEMTRTVG
jgi:DNA-binding transcriptional LysR family regulator